MDSSITVIQYKRGTKYNLETLLVGSRAPLEGEPIFETDTNRCKVGNGINDYKDLPYFGDSSDIFYEGYYLNNKFYKDSTYQEELPKDSQKIYINLNGNYSFYRYYGSTIGFKADVAEASEVAPGKMFLYNTHGQNTNGTMTQKAITDGVNSIKFIVEEAEDEDGDGESENVLVLDLP